MNRLQRQLEVLLKNYRILEARLEAGGVAVKSLGVRPLFQNPVHCLLALQAHCCSCALISEVRTRCSTSCL